MTLDEKIAEVQRDEAVRYQVVDIVTNRKEIREISERALEILGELRPDVGRMPWDALASIAILFVDMGIREVHRMKKELPVGTDAELPLGRVMTLRIEYTATLNADKVGTLNPAILVGPDFRYDTKDTPYDDAVSVDMQATLNAEGCPKLLPQFFDQRDVIIGDTDHGLGYKIKEAAFDRLHIVIEDLTLPSTIFVAFFRAAKEYLIQNKDMEEVGININLAEFLDFGISKEGPDDDIEYTIYLTPGQQFKLNFAKGDDTTEKSELS